MRCFGSLVYPNCDGFTGYVFAGNYFWPVLLAVVIGVFINECALLLLFMCGGGGMTFTPPIKALSLFILFISSYFVLSKLFSFTLLINPTQSFINLLDPNVNIHFFSLFYLSTHYIDIDDILPFITLHRNYFVYVIVTFYFTLFAVNSS